MSDTAKVYIAGPMRGYAELNFPAFLDASHRFRCAGWTVRNPVEIGREAFGLDPQAVSPAAFLREDVRILIDCDAIAVLPGWELSTGAKCEAAVARSLGLTFYDATTLEEIPPPSLIEIRGGYELPATLPQSSVPDASPRALSSQGRAEHTTEKA